MSAQIRLGRKSIGHGTMKLFTEIDGAAAALLLSAITHDAGTGILPGLVLGILAAYPIFKGACEERSQFLHPEPREYRVPAELAFAKIRDILAETSYNYGDKWNVVTADT